jgi:hypothetical protein
MWDVMMHFWAGASRHLKGNIVFILKHKPIQIMGVGVEGE